MLTPAFFLKTMQETQLNQTALHNSLETPWFSKKVSVKDVIPKTFFVDKVIFADFFLTPEDYHYTVLLRKMKN